MGYESKLYIVNKRNKYDGDEKRYAQVIATYDMCKYYGFGDTFKRKTDCFIYADDGNTKILEDCYGDELGEASIEDVIEFVKNNQMFETYRRNTPLLLS